MPRQKFVRRGFACKARRQLAKANNSGESPVYKTLGSMLSLESSGKPMMLGDSAVLAAFDWDGLIDQSLVDARINILNSDGLGCKRTGSNCYEKDHHTKRHNVRPYSRLTGIPSAVYANCAAE